MLLGYFPHMVKLLLIPTKQQPKLKIDQDPGTTQPEVIPPT